MPITRTQTVVDEATGEVSVYLATATDAPIPGDVDIVQAAIDTWAEPWGVTATAIAGTPHNISVTYEVWVHGSNLTSMQIQDAIALALAEWFSALDFGGYIIPPDTGAVYPDAIEQVIGHAVLGVLRVVVSVPAAAVPLNPNEFAKLSTITPTINIL